MRYFLFLMILIAGYGSAMAQSTAKKTTVPHTCQQAVMQAYTQLKTAQSLTNGKIAVFRFRTQTKLAGSSAPSSSGMLILKRGVSTVISTDETDIFQDGKYQVVINRAQKRIIISPQPSQATSPGFDMWLQMRDYVLTQTQVSVCELRQQGKARFVRLIPRVDGKLMGRLASVDYKLTAKDNTLQSITIHYLLGEAVDYTRLDLLAQESKPADARVDLPAIRQVQDAQRRTLPAYRHFTIEDLRPAASLQRAH